MSSFQFAPRKPAMAQAEERRERLMRDLKLALVDQELTAKASGCDPYDSEFGRARAERWQPRRR